MHARQQLALIQWNAMMLGQVLSPLNVWGTGKVIERSPNVADPKDRILLHTHYIDSGGLNRFAAEFELITKPVAA